MKPSEALANASREDIVRIVEAHRASNPRVFGSALHGDDEADSDLDILVDPAPDMSLFDIGDLQADLGELLGVPVDLCLTGELSNPFYKQAVAEARAI